MDWPGIELGLPLLRHAVPVNITLNLISYVPVQRCVSTARLSVNAV
jgi:hypothetical protein